MLTAELWWSGTAGAVAGGLAGSVLQVVASSRQERRERASQAEARADQLEDARLDRLETGAAELRAAALSVLHRVDFVRAANRLWTRRIAVDWAAKLGDLLHPLVKATTAIRVNGDNEVAAVADRILESTNRLASELGADDEEARQVAYGALAADVTKLEEWMRAARGYEALTDRVGRDERSGTS